jgi:hypothetical protein
VEEQGWKELVPALPDDVIDLLAPPVVVTAEAVAPASRVAPASTVAPGSRVAPASPVASASAVAPASPVVVVPVERARLVSPGVPRRLRRRSAP